MQDGTSQSGLGAGGRPGAAGSDVVTTAHAVALLPLPSSVAEQWLRDQSLVHELAGVEVVVWPDVLDALRGEAPLKHPPLRGSIVSEDRAARSLPWRRSDAVRWLREEGLSAVVAGGRRVVCWDHVLDHLSVRSSPSNRQRRPTRAKQPSVRLLAKPGRVLDP